MFIGQVLFESNRSWASEGIATLLFDRLKALSPAAAKLILDKIRFLPLNIARVKLVERISESTANIADLVFALRIRDTLAEERRVELTEMIKRGGYAGGIAAISLKDRDRQTPAVASKRMKGMVIRVRRGKAEISVYDAAGGQQTRVLSDGEFRELKNFTSRPEVDDLGPESWRINKPVIPYEYLRLTKEGGKRIILAGYDSAPKTPSLHERLADIFYRIDKSGESKPR